MRQGYVFTNICDSVHGDGCGRHPPGRHPPEQTPIPGQTPPGQTPPRQTPPMTTVADGTHLNGMHSCFHIKIVALQEISFEDVFTLQKVTQTEAANFNFVSGTVPLLRNMCLDVRLFICVFMVLS